MAQQFRISIDRYSMEIKAEVINGDGVTCVGELDQLQEALDMVTEQQVLLPEYQQGLARLQQRTQAQQHLRMRR